jgi:signal transduction histidine kinase
MIGTRVGHGFLDLKGDEEDKQQHQSFLEELQDIEKEIRDVSHKLSDNFNSSEISFTTIIGQLIKDKSTVGSFQSKLNLDKEIRWDQINELIKVNVYRIIQESLQNIIKHADAKNIHLEFSTSDRQLTIQLTDDGKGFNVKKSKKGIGMKNMKSRIQKLNGTIDFISEKGKGTSIHIKIPTN